MKLYIDLAKLFLQEIFNEKLTFINVILYIKEQKKYYYSVFKSYKVYNDRHINYNLKYELFFIYII